MVRLVPFIASLFIATGTSYRPGDEICVMNKENQCPPDQLTLSKTDASTLIYPGGKTRCAFDDYTSDHYKSNATYFFQAFPKKASKKLLFYYQGGGACTSELTCNFATQCSLPHYTFDSIALAASYGVLNASDPNNIFHDWNVVHIPYCTGDLFIGKNISSPVDFKDNGFVHDSCTGKNMSMHMNGYENTMSALDWALTNYPNPEHIVVAGASSGALAVQFWAQPIATMWNVQARNIKYGVIADSFVGVFPEPNTATKLIDHFGACDLLPTSIVTKCKDRTATSVEIIRAILQNLLFADWLHITSKADWVQRFFIDFAKLHISEWFNHNLNPYKFFAKIEEIINVEKEVSPRVSAFYIKGLQHQFLTLHEWYNITNADGNETLGAVIQAWLERGVNGDVTPLLPIVQTPAPEQ